jgi:apolipoprotein N-acyltransferase
LPTNNIKESRYLKKVHYLLALLSGALLTLAFAPIEYRLFAIISPAVLFGLLLKAGSVKQHLRLSYLFGLGLFGTGASWIFYSMYFFAHAHIVLAIGLTSLFVLIMALLFLLLGLLSYQLKNTSMLARLLLYYPAIWVLVEWFRGWFLTGFPWLNLGNAHIDNILVSIAPIAGSYAVSFFSATLSGALLVTVIMPLRDKKIALVTSICLLGSSYFLGNIRWTSPVDTPIKVSLLQGNIAQEKKWLPETLQPTLDLYQKLTSENWDSDLIIWPETAIPDTFDRHMDFITALQEKAIETDTDLLIGGFFYNMNDKAGIENSILGISGETRSIYSKQHLVPFTEYFPFLHYLNWLREWVELPYDSVKRGRGSTTLSIAGQIAQMSICYEDAYGSEIIQDLPEARLLINISNDGWFTGSIEPDQHFEIARMRAVETGRYLLRAANIGTSAIVDTKGKIIATANNYQTTTIKGLAQPYQGLTPYVHFGNSLIISFLFFILIVSRVIRIKV